MQQITDIENKRNLDDCQTNPVTIALIYVSGACRNSKVLLLDALVSLFFSAEASFALLLRAPWPCRQFGGWGEGRQAHLLISPIHLPHPLGASSEERACFPNNFCLHCNVLHCTVCVFFCCFFFFCFFFVFVFLFLLLFCFLFVLFFCFCFWTLKC